MSKLKPTAAEKRHLGRVANTPCVLCNSLVQPQSGRTTVHHIRTGQGGAQRASHWLTVALCSECHQGRLGVHGDQTLLRIAKVSELDLLALTFAAIEARGEA